MGKRGSGGVAESCIGENSRLLRLHQKMWMYPGVDEVHGLFQESLHLLYACIYLPGFTIFGMLNPKPYSLLAGILRVLFWVI